MMLSPIDDHRSEYAEVLGSISAAFIENEQFLASIRGGDEEVVRTELTKVLRSYYLERIRRIDA